MNNDTTDEQDRISQLYADNKAAFQAAQQSANKGEWQTFEKTPVTNDTPADAITATDNFRTALLNLADGCRLVADDEMQLQMVKPVEQPDGVTLDRLTREGWLERMPNGGTFKLSEEGLLAYLRYTDGRNDALAMEGGL